MASVPLEVKVFADWACFTRPELKVERVSYPTMTPTAAQGVLEAIFWKPEFRWVIREIVVLKPIAYTGILRNEVNNRASERSARAWEKAGAGGSSPARIVPNGTRSPCGMSRTSSARMSRSNPASTRPPQNTGISSAAVSNAGNATRNRISGAVNSPPILKSPRPTTHQSTSQWDSDACCLHSTTRMIARAVPGPASSTPSLRMASSGFLA